MHNSVPGFSEIAHLGSKLAPAVDAAIKRRCLNIIDDMLELGFSEIEKELAQVER